MSEIRMGYQMHDTISQTYRKMEACLRDPGCLEALTTDPDWRVRYAAAVAIGEHGDPAEAPYLEKMLHIEDQRSLYDQPNVDLVDPRDKTPLSRLAERIGPAEAAFPAEYSDEVKEAWKCRGRVKFACAKAVVKLGYATEETRELFRKYLMDEDEAYNVKAAVAHALSVIGTEEDIPALETALRYDEWCTQTEAKKAIRAIRNREEVQCRESDGKAE